MSSIMSPTSFPATQRPADARNHVTACLVWLAVASACTVIGLAERWPAQFGGAGDPSKIATQWMTKGTVLSPPLFMLLVMVAALALVLAGSRAGARALGAGLAIVAGAAGVVGSLGEVAAAATPAVPRAAQYSGALGAVLSLAVVVTGALFLRTLAKSRASR